jgi:hypothetical protein
MKGNGKDADTPVCEDCGQPVPTGSWPFCRSPQNPDGHAKGTYRWGLGTGMKKWERMSR